MRKLILVRHSESKIDSNHPPSQWRLTTAGRQRCIALARQLGRLQPASLVASTESKATETGQIVATNLGLALEIGDGLHEHERDEVLLMETAAFEEAVAEFFARPSELVLGGETANQAHRRFANSIERVMAGRLGGSVAIFTHGTVVTLLVSRATGLAPHPFWQSLGMPAISVLSWPELEMLELIPVVE